MRIGVPTEIKSNEFRVGLVPGSVRELTARGHEVVVQSGAGAGIFADDDAYEKAGARILPTAEAVFAEAEMIVKVKEPQAVEYRRLKPHQILFTYLHLAPDPEQARGLMASGATAIAYETVTDAHGGLPLLAPMSEVAGRLSIEAAAIALRRPTGGRGVLMGGVPGVRPAKVVVLGGGVVGTHAARMAAGLGAEVSIIDRSLPRLRQLDELFDGRVRTLASTMEFDRDRSARRRRGDRRGAGRRRQRAEARHPRHAPAHEARRRARRRVDRPGRLLRDLAADDARRPDLRGRRHHPLLRGEHAGRGAGHLGAGAQQRHAALRDQARQTRAWLPSTTTRILPPD